MRVLELRNSAADHQVEQDQNRVGVPSKQVEGRAAEVLELSVPLPDPPAPQDLGHVLCEDERRPLPLVPVLGLEVSQEVSEIDVEQPAVLGHHDVVVVSISDAKHVRGNGVARAAHGEVLQRLVHLRALLQRVDELVLPVLGGVVHSCWFAALDLEAVEDLFDFFLVLEIHQHLAFLLVRPGRIDRRSREISGPVPPVEPLFDASPPLHGLLGDGDLRRA